MTAREDFFPEEERCWLCKGSFSRYSTLPIGFPDRHGCLQTVHESCKKAAIRVREGLPRYPCWGPDTYGSKTKMARSLRRQKGE